MTFKTPSTTPSHKGQTKQQKRPSSDCLSTDKTARTAQERDTSREVPFSMGGMCRADGASTPLPTPASDSCVHDSSRVSEFPLAVPPIGDKGQFDALTNAVSDPKSYHPLIAVAAWCKLKALRGQPVSDQQLDRLGVQVDRIDRETIERAAREKRVRDKIRACAAQRGPAPLICPDAIA